jgi:hypothetical protein
MQVDLPLLNDGNTLGNEIDRNSGAKGSGNGMPLGEPGSLLAVSAYAPVFATPQDARAYWDMALRAYASPVPNARTTAKAFIKERLGIDGDAYVVAHFATPQLRSEGSADSTIKLTDALMRAFPEHSRHTFFGRIADVVGGVNTGGRESAGALTFVESVATCRAAGECFSRIGRFLWSRTGPGYVYNTFIGKGNVIDTVAEDLRPLDEAFGIYPISSTFLPEHASPLLLSQVIATFKEVGVFDELPYVKQLKLSRDRYWDACRSEWPLLARYRFVHQARWARGRGVLTQKQYELAMQGGAPNVALDGPITLQQLRSSPPVAPIRVRRLDINGYAASDIVRFVATDGSEVMYIADGALPFVVFRNESELRQWVVRQAKNPRALEELLSNFSIYNNQDGVFWTGVAQGLAKLANTRWTADGTTIDASDALITGDVFDDMRDQVEARLRDDAHMQVRTSWDAWRTTINRAATLIGPLGYVPPLAIPIQAGSAIIGLGTGVDQAVDGRTAEERKSALEQAVMTVITNASVAAAIGTGGSAAARTDEQASLASTAPMLAAPSSEASQSLGNRVGYVLEAVEPVQLPSASGQDSPTGGASTRPRAFDSLGNDPRTPFQPVARQPGYLVQTLPRTALERARVVINLKKAEVDETRHRMDDFRTDSLTSNRAGIEFSLDHSIVYRVDSRTPRQLLASGGFGPSEEFNDLLPMLPQRPTIGSGSLVASNLVFQEWQTGYPLASTFHQYAVWTEGRAVASASDNHDLESYDSALDEVHFPGDIPTKDIYIVDSFNPVYAEAIARIYESSHVSTPFGVSLEMFEEYLGGRLDIDGPNRFTPQRLSDNFSSHAPSLPASGLTPSTPHQPLVPPKMD